MKPLLRTLIVDDERLARRRLIELLEAHPEIEVIGEADDLRSTVAMCSKERPDLLFLDIQIPPHSGFDVIPLLEPLPRIVFVTAHDAFAVKAFEANASDYLLKPVHPTRLAETIRRLVSVHGPSAQEKRTFGELVTLKDKGEIRQIPIGKIAAIRAEADYSRVFISGGNPLMLLRPLHEWEAILPSPPHARLDRSHWINLNLVRSAKAINRNEAHVILDGVSETIILGRAASLRLKRLLEAHERASR